MNRKTMLAGAVIASLSLAGCSKESGSGADDLTSIYDEGAQTYHVRGEIVQLPSEGPPPTDLRIHHERIPNFIGKDGTVFVNSDGVTGMKAMTMAFPELGDGVSLDGLHPGDKIAFVLKVKWLETPSGVKAPHWLVSAVEPLPDDTQLNFGDDVAPATPHEHDGP
ncbi:MAG TPA: copper-binding protein [Phycisphaerales bacterium]|nr:copper-binding protein [Phycisphaerales bacterium]